MFARHVVAGGDDAARVARTIVEGLHAPDLRCAFVFADWRLDPQVIARHTQRALPAPVAGGTTVGVIAPQAASREPSAVGLGLYGDWLRVGVGICTELSKSPLTRSRDAVHAAATALGTTSDHLDAARHTAITIFDGRSGHEEAFCIGSAAAAPRIRFVGGCVATDAPSNQPFTWVNGEVMSDAGVVVILDSELPCHAVTSSHLVPTEIKTVVTGASGRSITELDGRPAAARFRDLIAQLGDTLEGRPTYSFARYVDGTPYVRSIRHLEGTTIQLASGVEPGHVLRVMRPGDLIGQTTRDLAAATAKVGGSLAALLAFSCVGRHWEASIRGLDRELAAAYAKYSSVGFQSFGEQSGMLLVNHTLTGLAIGARR
ncbi:MAG: FIST N-terminal domain-containing protein [Kofleriaceae bacterium]